MDIGRALTYMLEDQDKVKKILMGGILNLIPIVQFIPMGYWLVQTKNVYEGRELPLPEWSDLGAFFTKGLMAFLGSLIYFIPAILVFCCIWSAMFFAPGNDPNTGEMGPIAIVVMLCGICLIFLYALALLVFLPVLITRYAITEQFNVFFQIGQAWQLISANLGNYLMTLLVFAVARMIAGVGVVLCCVGVSFTGFWADLVGAHLFGNFIKTVAQPTIA